MSSHLNENQITDAVLGFAEESARRHLESCSECLQRVAAASALVSGFGKDARREAERQDGFWERQAVAIMERSATAPQTSSRRSRGLAWAWSAAAATAAAVLVLWSVPSGVKDSPPPPVNTEIAAYESDEQLLMQVEAALQRGTPAALAPAEVLTRELHRRAKAANVQQVSVSQN